ncbi:MAG: lipoyl synthase [Acidimicrobiia bacterium]|nr:lipoyl synthase [Acidimicrobiia bacterium]NNF11307.1 lipoyl synthase [Acidimicrobiia bacterium]
MRARWLGRLPYDEAWDLQRALHEGRVTGRTDDDYLLLLEHPPTYTVGRNGDGSNLLIDRAAVRELGAELFEVDRGGDITFHGPGQLVGYPIMALPDSRQIVPYVRKLEQALISTLAELGIDAWPEEGLTGVWTEQGKVAAIGVRVARGVSMHGFAVNLDPDLAYFDKINPCGLTRPVTSVSALASRKVSHEEFIDLLVPRFAEVFDVRFVEEQRAAFARGTGREFDVDRRVAAGTFSGATGGEPVLVSGRLAGEPERPEWMRVKAVMNDGYRDMKRLMRTQGLNTVCEEAGCPNIFECWESGTATLMLLGDTCTRACSFCDVKTGKPGEVDIFEPLRAAEAVSSMGLQHAVLTSVNRDDLDDGGSGIFAQTIEEIGRRLPDCDVEVLIPDFKGDRGALETVMTAGPAVLNHNTETVLRLQRDIRTAANYGRSLALLARAKWLNPAGFVKSGLIVGMGETEEEVVGALADLRAVGVDIVTIGQYLRPSARHRPIDRYVHPDEFDRYRKEGERLGFAHIESGPLVRSSYHAKEAVSSKS